MKFYIHISKEEQLSRFKTREADPYKHWKIDEEDWRNRRKWREHNAAGEEMFRRTSPRIAPWHLIEGNYKWYARVKVLKIIARRFEMEFGKKRKKRK